MKNPLRAIAIALVAGAVVNVLLDEVSRQLVLYALQHGRSFVEVKLESQLIVAGQLAAWLASGTVTVVALGLVGGRRPAATVTAVIVGLELVFSVARTLWAQERSGSIDMHTMRVLFAVGAIVYVASRIAVAYALADVAGRGRPFAILAGAELVGFIWPNHWLLYVGLAVEVALGVVAWIVAARLPAEPRASLPAGKLSAAWRAPTEGLALVRDAIVARLVILVVGTGATALAIAASHAPPEGFAIVVGLADTCALGAFVWGTATFAGIPASPSTRAIALTAAILVAFAAAGAICTTIEAYRLVVAAEHVRSSGSFLGMFDDLETAQRRLVYQQLAGSLVGLGGAVTLLAAARAVAQTIGDAPLAGRLGLVAIGVAAGGTLALVGQFYLARAADARPQGLLTIGVVAVALGVAVFAAYVTSIGRFVGALRLRL